VRSVNLALDMGWGSVQHHTKRRLTQLYRKQRLSQLLPAALCASPLRQADKLTRLQANIFVIFVGMNDVCQNQMGSLTSVFPALSVLYPLQSLEVK
jgi:hypothetical protein